MPGRTPLFRNVMRTLAQTSALRSRRDFLRMTSAAGLVASLGV